jgi:hypothetical protein
MPAYVMVGEAVGVGALVAEGVGEDDADEAAVAAAVGACVEADAVDRAVAMDVLPHAAVTSAAPRTIPARRRMLGLVVMLSRASSDHAAGQPPLGSAAARGTAPSVRVR